MKNLTILAVNDVPDQLELLVFILGQAGYRVLSAANGVEALETARRESPDLIISDVAMPEMNGIDFCRAVRADERLSATPFLLISALHKDTEYAVKGLEAGADDYVESPFEPMRLVAKAARLVERKTVLEAYRDSERRYRNFIEQSTEGIWRVEFKEPISIDLPVDEKIELSFRHAFYAECNDAMARMYGLESAEDLTGRYVSEFLVPSDSANREFVRAFMENGYRLNDGESHEIVAGGADKNFLNNFIGMVAGGNLVSVWGIRHDITEQRKIENALRANRESLEIAQKAAKIGSFEFEYETQHLTCSASMETLYGAAPGSLSGNLENWIKYVHPEDLPIINQNLTPTLTSDEYRAEFRVLLADGSLRWIVSKGKIFFDDEKKPLRVVGVNIDITERKQVATAVRFQKTLLEAQNEASIDGILVVAPDDEILSCNRRFTEMWEVPENVIASKSGERLIQSVVDKLTEPQKFKENIDYLHRHPHVKDHVEINLKDGRTFEWFTAPVIDVDETYFGRIRSFRDITERKRAEAALKQSEQDYRTVFEQAHDAILIFAPEGEIVLDVNRRACEIYGFSRSEFVGMSIETISKFPANGKDKVKETMEIGDYLNFETIQFRKDGSEMSLEVNASTVNYQGQQAIITINRDITERKRVEAALRKAEANYRNLVESSPGIVYLSESTAPYSNIYVSPNVIILGYSPEEWYAKPDMWASLLHYEDRERVVSEFEYAVKHNLESELEYRVVARDGTIYWWLDRGGFVVDDRGGRLGWQGIILDITKTKALEEQLRQSQKLESVGRMAGGIAHDFNNMLTAINGYSDLTLRRLKPEDPLRGNIEEIKKAGERSAQLTQQLLAFSRRQVLKPKILNLNEVILETSKLLERLIGEDIQFSIVPFSGLGLIEADPGQLTQVIINLAINARDAMPRGGNLAIETSNVYLDEEFAAAHVPTQAGSYVLLSVSDSGVGMSVEVKRHIFEPFYTTKEIGKGTGLGLATVYGIVKQSEGYIWVESEEGAGTTFKIYLPRVDEDAETSPAHVKTHEIIERGTETILLVEDEEIVRNMSRQMLEACGYRVIEAANGLEALALCEAENRKIDLLLTDVVMPKMGGRELAEKLAQKYPHIRLLYTSGYTDDAVIRQGIMTEDMNFIQKPFDFDELAKKIRELLDAKK